MIEVGKVNELLVCRENDSGYFLKSTDPTKEIFMPPALALCGVGVGQTISVFVYPDKIGRFIATQKIPYAVVGEYALLTAIEVQDFGAFFDWGIEKDLLVPGNEQKEKVRLNESYLVRVCLEEETNRVYGTTKIGKYVAESKFDITVGEEVEIQPVIREQLGYRSIINKKLIGMIFHNEIFYSFKLGDRLRGVVKNIREDGLVDAALQAQGFEKLVEAKRKILEMLKKNNGTSVLGDKSASQEIRDLLGMSKKTFKSAIGMLYKEGRIVISKDGIQLLE